MTIDIARVKYGGRVPRPVHCRDLDEWRSLSAYLARTRADDRRTLAQVLVDMSVLAWDVAPEAELHGRLKSPGSLLDKMRTLGLDVDEVADAIGVRVVVPREEECYRLVGRVHARFTALEAEFDDYILHPKPNGYRSLHTTVLAFHRVPVELQIRTPEMHAAAEQGAAAHWLYKQRRALIGMQIGANPDRRERSHMRNAGAGAE